jgi:DNA polymerase-4
MQQAIRRCPQAVVIEPTSAKYSYYSGRIMDIFREVTPLVEPLSVDEAFLDVAGAVRRLGPPLAIGQALRSRLKSELGLTATVGIAASKFVAKIASTRAKPDGLLLIEPADTVPYLHTLPVEALWGVGAKTGEVLARLGLHTVRDLAQTPVGTLKRALGATGEHIHRLAWGLDERRVEPVRQEKSIGAEHTFALDTADTKELEAELLRLAHRTAGRLRAQQLQCRAIALKLRYSDFSTISRSRTLPQPTDSSASMYAEAAALLHKLGQRTLPVRLVGIRAEQLEAAGGTMQLTIDRRDGNWRDVESALDRVNAKFGTAGLLPAALLPKPQQQPRPGPP